MLTKKTRYW